MRSLLPLTSMLTLAIAPAMSHAQVPIRTSNPTEPVSMVVFSDFECPYSAKLYPEIQKLQSRFPGQIHIAYKQLPLPIHPDSPLAHRAALAAGRQGKFDAMAELLYSNQKPQDLAALVSFARQLHLDVPRFRRDMESASVTQQLEADVDEARALAIEQTPTVFINGKTLVGYQSEQTLENVVVKGLATAAQAPALPEPDNSAPLSPDLRAVIETNAAATQGPADAPLTIVEFTDFQCPFCRAAVSPMEQLMNSRGKQVRWVVHTFPLDFHPDSELASEAALAAGEQGKFWQMQDLLFANQSALKLENLRNYAEQLHLNMQQFNEALATRRFAGRIAADRALGTRAGVSGTPTFVVYGQLMTGARSLAELTQLADAHVRGSQPALSTTATRVMPPTLPDQQVAGSSSAAPLTLTWFSDVRSPLAERQAELIRKLAAMYDGRVRVLFRAYPLESHADGVISSQALLAALKQGKFWEMYNAIAERRDLLDTEKLATIASGLKMDLRQFAQDMPSSSAEVSADIDEATRRGIQGAPVLFVNRQRVDGLQQQQLYVTIMNRELEALGSSLSAANH